MPSHAPDTILICSNAQCGFEAQPWAVSDDVCPRCGADLDEVESRPQRRVRAPLPQRRPIEERQRPTRPAKGRRPQREKRDF